MVLTPVIRDQVITLRRRGLSYGKIADELSLSRNTIKSLCQRENVIPYPHDVVTGTCQQCGCALQATKNKQRFCTSACRLTWWHTHPEDLNRRAWYTLTCHGCQQSFTSYGNKYRKYCSHPCYIHHRFHTRGGR